MRNHSGLTFVATLFVLFVTLLPGQALAAVRQRWNAHAAAKYLDQRGDEWLNWSGAARGQGTACLSCHTAMPVALARPALAKQLGETAASEIEKKMIEG